MKKLILMILLGVCFFIGGQWLGLSVSQSERGAAPIAQPGSDASGTQESGSHGGNGP